MLNLRYTQEKINLSSYTDMELLSIRNILEWLNIIVPIFLLECQELSMAIIYIRIRPQPNNIPVFFTPNTLKQARAKITGEIVIGIILR